MAVFNTIPDSDVDPESPGTTTLFTWLRDNLQATVQGATGAFKILTAAIEDENVTTIKLETAERMNATNVAAIIAGLSTGDVGTYAFLSHSTAATSIVAGSTYAGSVLRYSGALDNGTTLLSTAVGATPSGTWRAMGTATASAGVTAVTLFLRIS